MATTRYLAMTAWDFAAAQQLPSNIGWMACHFSPDSPELTNLPDHLPSGSLLILNDRIPMDGQDVSRILDQLQQAVEALECRGVLLDFQRPDIAKQAALAAQLTAALPCPVAVSDLYAKKLDCPVFLSPCPHHVPLPEHIRPWQGRELWLDLAADWETITLTPQGASICSIPSGEMTGDGHQDRKLHCHYITEVDADCAWFTLWRTTEDLQDMAEEAEQLGIQTFVGLYQELG